MDVFTACPQPKTPECRRGWGHRCAAMVFSPLRDSRGSISVRLPPPLAARSLTHHTERQTAQRRAMDKNQTTDTPATSGFLPDFCNLRTILVVVVIAELLVFVLVLAQPPGVDRWQALSLYTLYVQWIALGCTLALCLSRSWLARMRPHNAGLIAWLMVLAITAVVAWLAWGLVLAESGSSSPGFMARSLGIAALVAAVVLRYFYLQEDWRRRIENASAARLQALQARIRPHFLFNSLNTIASMIRARPEQAETAVEDLADLFRASLESGDELARLEDEIRLAEGYLHMEQLRLGERLAVVWQIDGLPGDAHLPPLTLQPLLENAVYHGIEPRRDGGVIRILGQRQARTLMICVDNPLPTSDRDSASQSGLGMAQANVAERLQHAFGSAAHLLTATDADRYRVCLHLPYRQAEAATQGGSDGGADAHTHRR